MNTTANISCSKRGHLKGFRSNVTQKNAMLKKYCDAPGRDTKSPKEQFTSLLRRSYHKNASAQKHWIGFKGESQRVGDHVVLAQAQYGGEHPKDMLITLAFAAGSIEGN